MKKSEKKLRMAKTVDALKQIYPDPTCALQYGGDPWRLLVMGRLSAQCTDARVNEVCKHLFTLYPTAEKMMNADISELEEAVKPCGLFRMKAKDLKEASRMLCEEYAGVLPDTMEELLRFSGVGRKIANLLLGDIYKKPAIVTDTHCIRICGRLGFYPEKEKTPYKIERILSEITEPCEQSDFCHRLVWFGRDICTARSPKCERCPLGEKGLCDSAKRRGLHK